MELDLVIRDGVLVDPVKGTEERLNLGIAGDKIAFIGKDEPPAKKVLEAFDLLVTPGFVDTHMHDEELDDPGTIQKALLRQGVTTALAGNCGSGPGMACVKEKRKSPWINLGYLSGHTALREAVGISDVYQPATEAEITRMEELLEKDLADGAFGLSSAWSTLRTRVPGRSRPFAGCSASTRSASFPSISAMTGRIAWSRWPRSSGWLSVSVSECRFRIWGA